MMQRVETVVRRGSAHDRASGRALLRLAVAELAGVSAEAVTLRAVCPDCGGDHGRPIVLEPNGVWVSLTRASGGADAVVVASTEGPVGIDAEPWDLDPGRVAGAAAALGLARDVTSDDARAVIRAWTITEAVLKADGRGVRVDPSRVHVAGTALAGMVDARLATIADEPARWSVEELHDPAVDPLGELCITLARATPLPVAVPN